MKTLRRTNSLSRSVFSTAGSFGSSWLERAFKAEAMNIKHSQRSCTLPTLSFLALNLWISLVNYKQGKSLVILVFSPSFQRILCVRNRKGRKILGNFDFGENKKKQGRGNRVAKERKVFAAKSKRVCL